MNEDVYENVSSQPDFVRPPNEYGAVPGVEIGFHWETRLECSRYGVHRPTVAGIHGGPKGAYSIALSGGYPVSYDLVNLLLLLLLLLFIVFYISFIVFYNNFYLQF